METDHANRYSRPCRPKPSAPCKRGGADAYGLTPERRISDGDGVPCRHCLQNVAAGEPYLVLAYRPFPDLQPYAETGPIFLHAEACERAEETPTFRNCLPGRQTISCEAMQRTTASSTAPARSCRRRGIPERAAHLLSRADMAYLHMRSARNNCYQCRIERDGLEGSAA